MKEVSPKKYTKFKCLATSRRNNLFWHGRSIKEFVEYSDSTWTMDQKLSHEEIENEIQLRPCFSVQRDEHP